MDWQTGMSQAIDYIERNIMEDVDYKEAARYTGCSVWEFQRIFSFLTHLSLGEYIRGRRLSLAAAELQAEKTKIIDIAMKYGYESHAAFSRAFARFYGITPSEARNTDIVLKAYPQLNFQIIMNERIEEMKKYSSRGYVVRENGPVYFTDDMDKTVKWFEEILGWYGDVAARDSEGAGEYGCVFDYPGEVAVAHIVPFRGFHLFKGEGIKGVAGFLMVEGLDSLHALVKKNGWEQISDIYEQPWGSKECSITTIDGSILRFFETYK